MVHRVVLTTTMKGQNHDTMCATENSLKLNDQLSD
jgi:hypothetical protein